MIDYFCKWTSAAACKSDPIVQSHYSSLKDVFSSDMILVNPVVWRASQDTTSTPVVHTPLAGFFLVISLSGLNNTILNAAALQFALDRDKCNASQPGMVVKNNLTSALLLDMRFAPVWCGANYPFGGFV